MKETTLVLIGALLAILSSGCTHNVLNSENTVDRETSDQHRQVASAISGVRIIESDGRSFLFSKDRDNIVIEECIENIIHLNRQYDCGEAAQLPVVEISVDQFKELLKIALMVPANYTKEVKKSIDLFKEKEIDNKYLAQKKSQLLTEIQGLKNFADTYEGQSRSKIENKENELKVVQQKISDSDKISDANTEITKLIDRLVDKVSGGSGFQEFSSGHQPQSFELNILRSYVRMHGLFIGWVYSKIEGGRFKMGNFSLKKEDDKGEVPHPVELTNDFEIQQTEVTQAQWLAVMGNNPSKFQSKENCQDHLIKQGVTLCLNHPVEQVSWNQVQEFIKKVNGWDKKYTYRLPTEAEWEYAARGHNAAGEGDAVRENKANRFYFFGEDSSNLDQYAWYRGKARGQTQPVATKKPNSNQLYDVYGNVSEWVQDWYRRLPSKLQIDPVGPKTGDARVVRNGHWNSEDSELYSARRFFAPPDDRSSSRGFRLVRTAK